MSPCSGNPMFQKGEKKTPSVRAHPQCAEPMTAAIRIQSLQHPCKFLVNRRMNRYKLPAEVSERSEQFSVLKNERNFKSRTKCAMQNAARGILGNPTNPKKPPKSAEEYRAGICNESRPPRKRQNDVKLKISKKKSRERDIESQMLKTASAFP